MARRRRESVADRRERHAAVDDLDQVVNAAARLLEARPRSVWEVHRRLTSSGYQPALVESAVARLIELGYLDDETFARAWIESRDRAHPRGERALRNELFGKGIDRELVGRLLAERGEAVDGAATELERPDVLAAGRLLERRRASLMREPDPARRRQKAYALLARNGFDPDVSRTVAASFERSAGGEVQAESVDLTEP